MPSLNPSAEQLKRFAEQMPAGEPILMLNLLRFNQQAAYPADSDQAPCSGKEAYARYSRTALQKVRAAGGDVQVAAKAQVALIAPEQEHWDEMLLVRYPSPDAFLAMLSDEQYQAATLHRTAALADSRLIACSPRA
ncbi:DUF1330 domain-containing protein [Pseudomonas sp. KSR10]|jgi:uncharacterized protein (DUF1330 family)|uniref:DUF1330 domain-containing protein n=1 Tax=Stutzerimonas stutzeri TaxID=316 RepID=A0A0D9AFR0_STUST|nr:MULTISPECIES: DUF1330 domain-containing protein [Pseudomonadaceae]KJH79574.1 hypothetical protein UF78_20680 [Stutzerimonas stutzeri]MCG6541191.1 DUF1330 domain-containing protein [Pseudomonas sp. KSR10]